MMYLIEMYHCFKGTYNLYLQVLTTRPHRNQNEDFLLDLLFTEHEVKFCEMSLNFYQTSEDSALNKHWCENITFKIVRILLTSSDKTSRLNTDLWLTMDCSEVNA